MADRVVAPLKTSSLSLPVQVQQYLLSLIADGTYQPGEQLPPQTDLANQLGVSRPTLREALLNLEQDGVILRKHGVGTFVSPGYGHWLESGLERLESILELAGRQGMQLTFDALQVTEKPAGSALCDTLRVAPGTPLTSVQRVIVADGMPVALMLDHVLSSVLSPADIDETFNGSVLDLLRRKQSTQLAQAVANVVALNADAFLAEQLEVQAGEAVLLVEETVFDEEGEAIEFSRNYFIPGFFRFRFVRR
jgi:GntR family transcriptional regulator